MPAVPAGICTAPADVGGIVSAPKLNPAPVLAAVAAPKVGKLLAGCCSVPKPPGVPNVGAAEAALTAGVPAAAANAGADVVGDPKPKPPPAAGAPEPKPVLAGAPNDGTPPTPKAGADAPNAEVAALPNAGADPPRAGVLDAPNAAPLAPKLQVLLAEDKPPNAGVEAPPEGAAAEPPIEGIEPPPKPGDAGLITVSLQEIQSQSHTQRSRKPILVRTEAHASGWRKCGCRAGTKRRRSAACGERLVKLRAGNSCGFVLACVEDRTHLRCCRS